MLNESRKIQDYFPSRAKRANIQVGDCVAIQRFVGSSHNGPAYVYYEPLKVVQVFPRWVNVKDSRGDIFAPTKSNLYAIPEEEVLLCEKTQVKAEQVRYICEVFRLSKEQTQRLFELPFEKATAVYEAARLMADELEMEE